MLLFLLLQRNLNKHNTRLMFNMVLKFAHYRGICREFWIFAKKDKNFKPRLKKRYFALLGITESDVPLIDIILWAPKNLELRVFIFNAFSNVANTRCENFVFRFQFLLFTFTFSLFSFSKQFFCSLQILIHYLHLHCNL